MEMRRFQARNPCLRRSHPSCSCMPCSQEFSGHIGETRRPELCPTFGNISPAISFRYRNLANATGRSRHGGLPGIKREISLSHSFPRSISWVQWQYSAHQRLVRSDGATQRIERSQAEGRGTFRPDIYSSWSGVGTGILCRRRALVQQQTQPCKQKHQKAGSWGQHLTNALQLLPCVPLLFQDMKKHLAGVPCFSPASKRGETHQPTLQSFCIERAVR